MEHLTEHEAKARRVKVMLTLVAGTADRNSTLRGLDHALVRNILKFAWAPVVVETKDRTVTRRDPLTGLLHSYGVDDPPAVELYGSKSWNRYGKLHRDGDLPAVVSFRGDLMWYKDGERHRGGDLPAVVSITGDMSWYKHGEQHRDGDEPAVIGPNGYRCWYKHGALFREGDKPCVVKSDGTCVWRVADPYNKHNIVWCFGHT